MSNELLWYLSRATGITSIALLTAVLLLGGVTSGRRRPVGERATILMGLHRWLSLGMVAFLGVHITTAIAETYVSIDWISALVPFTSAYSTAWVGLGTLAFDLVLAVVATSLLRQRIPERLWRRVHWGAYAMWPIALVHGLMLATSAEPILTAITIACGAVGAAGIAWRLSTGHADRDARRGALQGEWS